MINLSDITEISEHVLTRSRTMLCQRRGPNAWRVTPKRRQRNDTRPHTSKLVEFVKTNQWKARCSDFYTGEPCPANQFGTLCSHVYRVYRQLQTNNLRQRNREAAEKCAA